MRKNIAIVLALCSMSVLSAPDPNAHPVLIIDIDSPSYPVLDTFGNPTLVGTQLSYKLSSGSTWDNQQRIEIPIDEEDIAADSVTAYVYRQGCRVVYYHIEGLKKDSLHHRFQCEPAAEKPITVKIENADRISTGDLFAWVSYTSSRTYKLSNGTLESHDVRFSVGVFPIASDYTFTLPMPDFGNDPILLKTTPTSLDDNPLGTPSRFEIFVSRLHGGVFGQLLVDPKRNEPLVAAREYPTKLSLTFVAQR